MISDIYKVSSKYTLTCPPETLHQRFKADPTEGYRPTYNASPTDLLPVLINDDLKGFSYFYWGATPQMANNKAVSAKLYNARAEELLKKASYRNALQSRRCLVPVDGYYDWKRISKKGRIPHWVHLPGQELFALAGLWDEYEDEEGETHHTFTIITVSGNNVLEDSASEMPAILKEEDEEKWLDTASEPDALIGLLQPFPGGKMEHHSVSPRVNDPRNNSADLIRHVPPADQFGNYTLFN